MSVHNRKVIILAAICLLLTFFIVCVDVFLIHKAPQVNGDLTVTFLDVGQGDCILVSCDGQHMLIDGGAPEASQIVYSFLKQKNINHLSYLLSTHPHNDHTGGLSAALQMCSVDHIFSPVFSVSYYSSSFSSFLSAIEKRGKEIEKPSAGDEFMLGKAKCKILAPLSSPDHLERAENANDKKTPYANPEPTKSSVDNTAEKHLA